MREWAKGRWRLLELGQDGGEEPMLLQQQRDRGISPAPNSVLGLPKLAQRNSDCNCEDCNKLPPLWQHQSIVWYFSIGLRCEWDGGNRPGPHLYQDQWRMLGAILKDFIGCMKKKEGLVQPPLEKEEYEIVAVVWYLQQVTLEACGSAQENYGFLSHFGYSLKPFFAPLKGILSETIKNILWMKKMATTRGWGENVLMKKHFVSNWVAITCTCLLSFLSMLRLHS